MSVELTARMHAPRPDPTNHTIHSSWPTVLNFVTVRIAGEERFPGYISGLIPSSSVRVYRLPMTQKLKIRAYFAEHVTRNFR